MIKLVTQFDNEKSRIALATPTCCGTGCSCCCCCCLISVLTVSAITARSFGKHTFDNGEYNPSPPKKRDIPAMLMFFFIPLLIIAIVGFLINEILIGSIISALALAGLSIILVKRKYSIARIIVHTIISLVVMIGVGFVELFLLGGLFDFNIPLNAYLTIAAILPILIMFVKWKK